MSDIDFSLKISLPNPYVYFILNNVVDSFFLPTLAGLLWGSTNPVIKIGSKGMINIKGTSTILTFTLQVKFLCSNWKVPDFFDLCMV